jgi:hypothetical protein
MSNRTAEQIESILEQAPQGAYIAIGRLWDGRGRMAVLRIRDRQNRDRPERYRAYGHTVADAVNALEEAALPAIVEMDA